MTDALTFRWIDGPVATDDDWDKIEHILAARGWMSLNRNTTRILVAETPDGKIAGFQTLQLVPHTEPLFVAPSQRGTGLAEELTERMYAFLTEVHVRGFVAIAESRFAEELCEKHGMKKVACPVYVKLSEATVGEEVQHE